jgi:hypothetical protein
VGLPLGASWPVTRIGAKAPLRHVDAAGLRVTTVGGVRGVVGEFVRFTPDDGPQCCSSPPRAIWCLTWRGAGRTRGARLTERLHVVAQAAEEVAGSVRSRLTPTR